ncbi:MAG: hypothetical protein OEQ53_02670 [Saprospiraceae bacterium]|nr:hypothetical protein [Saprospiraceae bacterium]
MRWIALSITFFFTVLALYGIARPEVLFETMDSSLSPVFVYCAATIRVVYGLTLIGAARTSRFPRALRIIGTFLILAGIIALSMGVSGFRAVFDFVSPDGAEFMRIGSTLTVFFFVFILFALIPRAGGAVSTSESI